MRRLVSILLLSACATGRHITTEHVGTGVAFVSARGAAPAQSPVSAQLAPGDYDLLLHFDVPRAQLVEWQVTCPGATTEGSAGETFEAYRKRRLAQLEADTQRARQVASTVAPSVRARVVTPTGVVESRVDTAPIAANAIESITELPPGDVGAGRVQTTVRVATTSPGACVVTAVADDANVLGGYEIVHVRDLDAEARARLEQQRTASLAARVQLSQRLVAYGADAGLRQRQRDAEAQARAREEAREGEAALARQQAELRVHEQAQANIEAHRREVIAIDVRAREVSLDARARYRALLITWGADAGLRARLRIAADAQARARADAELRARLEVQARIEADQRAHAELEIRIRGACMAARERYRALLVAWGADPNLRERRAEQARVQIAIRETHERDERARIDAQLATADLERKRLEARRLEVAMSARTQVRAYLVSLGARERPPMPALRPENPGSAPFAGASWIAGHWTWTGVEWSWVGGGWRDSSVTFGATGGDVAVGPVGGVVDVGGSVGGGATVDMSVPTAVIVAPPPVETVRDHRTVVVQPPRQTQTQPVRDHRTEPKKDDPKVRDHRR